MTTPSTWIDRISRARKRKGTRDWLEAARKAVEIYEGERQDNIAFNILYSNTETLLPALYNSLPRPVVQRRFKDEDPVGRAAAMTGQRIAEFCLDTNGEEYQPFDDAMLEAVLDAAVPGRGVTRVRYDADIYEASERSPALLNGEAICYESVKWNKIIFGFARKWNRVPWIAFEHDITQEESVKLFGLEVSAQLQFTEKDELDTSEDRDEKDRDSDLKTAKIYEIWDKTAKEIVFVADCYKDSELKIDPDPGHFDGFFPLPEPLRFLKKANNQTPSTLYSMYENQAQELNRITVRINKIVEAVKVRGVYDSTITELATLFEQDDNRLVQAENAIALQEKGGLEKAIWLVPIEKYVAVLQQLYLSREACKQVIYEITGIADIMRGVTKASETLGAQELKDQWGTLRLKRMQRDVARYARDLVRMTIEVAAKTLTIPTVQKMTGLPFPTAEMQAQAQQAVQTLQAQGQPPPPEALKALQAPPWELIMSTLKDNTLRQYKIDIETNSTVDLEATEDKKDISELMNSMGQVLNGIGPLVAEGIMPFEAAQAMLLMITRQFRFGNEIEDLVKQMQPPQPKDDGSAAKAQAAIVKAQMQVQQVEGEKQDLERKVKLDLRELDLRASEADLAHREEIFQLQKEMALKEQETAHAAHMVEVQGTVQKATQAHEQKVKGMVDASAKESGKVKVEAAGQKAQAGVLQSFAKLQQEILKTVMDTQKEQAKQTTAIIEALNAEKEVVRDPKGRAQGVKRKEKV